MAAVDWDARAAVARCAMIAWEGDAWRGHKAKWDALDPEGSRRTTGRYNRGLDHYPESGTWRVLYLGLGRDVCIGEALRHLDFAGEDAPALFPQLASRRITRIHLRLSAVADCRDTATLGLDPGDLFPDTDYWIPHALAGAAIAHGAEGMIVPSATGLGDNLIIFFDHLRADSTMQIVDFVDPRLVVRQPKDD